MRLDSLVLILGDGGPLIDDSREGGLESHCITGSIAKVEMGAVR